MRKLKTLFLAILCLALPVQGIAGISTFEVPCPMMLTMADDMADAGAMNDCCNDVATAAKTGKACKSGQECPSGFQYALPSPLSASYSGFVGEAIPHFENRVFAALDKGVWRPPSKS